MDLKETKEVTNLDDRKIIETKLASSLGVECAGKIRIFGTIDNPLYVVEDVMSLFGKSSLHLYSTKLKYIDNIHKCKVRDELNGHNLIVFTKVGITLVVIAIRHRKLKEYRCKKCTKMANIDYGNYCKLCYRALHPENTYNATTVASMVKETALIKVLADKIDRKFVCNQAVGNGYPNYRPDIYFDCKEYAVMVEIDEYQHKRYENEEKRMQILQERADKPTHIIRFNPDSYFVGIHAFASCWRDDIIADQPAWEARLAKLIELLEQIFKTPGTEKLTIHKLYYDS